MVWDGDCHFCRRWIERWREITGGAVEYVESQKIGDAFPEIERGQFETSVVLIEPNGQVFTAAEAVFRSLGSRAGKSWLGWIYSRSPVFAALSEFGYGVIARHRRLASVATRVLWGYDVRPPTYFAARRWFLRGLALVYFVAFVSLWVQVDGLVGANGILPIADLLADARAQIGSRAFWILPTLCWANSSNTFLHLLCGSGAILSIVLVAGIFPAASLGGLFVCYLSLAVAGQTFLGFQWDILLLEAGFLAIFLAPWRVWPKRRPTEAPVNRVAFFLLKLLLFKLMFMSGVVKLTSGDDSWWKLTALDYHYWSQPLPTVFAWWADQNPEWFRKMSVAVCLIIEVVAPFFIWAPRRPRLIAAVLLIFLQLAIALSGNYCFFNLLTIVLCLLLIDDRLWMRRSVATAPGGTRAAGPAIAPRRLVLSHSSVDRIQSGVALLVLLATLPLNAWYIYAAFKPEADMPSPIRVLAQSVAPLRIASGYGLFRVMTKDRKEIEIEGSRDGIDWFVYPFKWKPGDVTRPPGWCAPHQPRLDWQMWFAALSSVRQNTWFINLAVRLLENKPEVTQLFAHNPFPGAGPRYIRAMFYRYRFTTAEERGRSRAWWKREELGEYLPTISAEQLR
jgi:predicted DCC family thiol-disulfide oxidoreductase YuxK